MPFSLGPWELIIVLLIVVVIFGAGRLGEIGGALGKGIREFRTATKDDDAQAAASTTVVTTTAPAAPVAPVAAAPVAPAPVAAAEVKCPSCGTMNPPTQAFCGQCGTRITKAA